MKLKRPLLIVLGIVISGLLGFTGYYGYTRKNLRDRQNLIAEAVRRGEVLVDYELHHWQLKELDSSPYSPLEIEFFVRNKGSVTIAGYLVFKAEIDSKGLEQGWMDVAIDKMLKDGYTMEQLKSEEFAKMTDKAKAIYHYLKRDKKLPPNLKYEPMESTSSADNYSFTFRNRVFLKPGEVQRFVHSPDLPYNRAGLLLKVSVNNIEF